MDSPSAVIALLLWLILIFLTIGQCRKWKKSERNEKIIYQNHSAIPTKEYKLSEFVEHDVVEEKPKLILANKLKQTKPNPEKQRERLSALKHSWDV